MTATTQWVDVARSFTPQIEEVASEAEQNRRLPTALIDAWRDAGLYNLWVPREYGGAEIDFSTMTAVTETIAAADGSAGWTLMIGASGGAFGGFLPPDTARDIYGSGRTVIAGSVTPRNAATPVEGGFKVKGRWPFASGCPEADWLLAAALDPSAEPGSSVPGGPPPILGMVLPAASCRIVDTWNSLGLRATSSHDFEVEDAFVPDDHTIGGFLAKPLVAGPLYKGGLQNLLQLGLTGVYLGIARSAVDSVIDLANQKTPTMRPSRLRESPVAQTRIAQAQACYLSARALAFDTMRTVQEALTRDGGLTPRFHALRQMTLPQVARLCAEAVDIAYEVGGTTGVYAGNKLERCFRDIHVATQHMGASPNQFAMAGLTLLDEAQAAGEA